MIIGFFEEFLLFFKVLSVDTRAILAIITLRFKPGFYQRRVLLAGSNNNSYQLMWILGLALTLPMILLCGPLAGYLVGYSLVNKLHLPGFLLPLLMIFGLVASGTQTYLLIRKLMLTQKNQKNPEK